MDQSAHPSTNPLLIGWFLRDQLWWRTLLSYVFSLFRPTLTYNTYKCCCCGHFNEWSAPDVHWQFRNEIKILWPFLLTIFLNWLPLPLFPTFSTCRTFPLLLYMLWALHVTFTFILTVYILWVRSLPHWPESSIGNTSQNGKRTGLCTMDTLVM